MGRVKDESLFLMLRNYLTVYLPTHRKCSSHTIITYRTTWNQFLQFAADKKKIPYLSVTFEMLDAEMTQSYLSWLEEIHSSEATRNNRLAAIRAFWNYAAACRPEYISRVQELTKIRLPRTAKFSKVTYMSEAAVKAILSEPDNKTKKGLRDQFFMILLYDTGARISEVLGLRICDIRDDSAPVATLRGKGRKTRIVPLMQETIRHYYNYLAIFHKDTNRLSETLLFYSDHRGRQLPLCDDTIRVRMKKYALSAAQKCNDVPLNLHPHIWRHSRAMHLYQHGMDLTLISQWLGHSQIETTLGYAYADTENKRAAIERAMAEDPVLKNTSDRYQIEDEETIKRLYGLK